jgi:hypothetical protein
LGVRENKIGQGGSRGRGGGRAKADRRGSRARRAERRNTRTWGVRDRATRLGAGVPARSRANAHEPAPGKADVRDTLMTERAGERGIGYFANTRGHATHLSGRRSESSLVERRSSSRVACGPRAPRSGAARLARASGANLRAQRFPCPPASQSVAGAFTLIGFRFGFRSIAIGAFSVVLRNSPVVDPDLSSLWRRCILH